MSIIIECVICGNKFKVPASRKESAKYCSLKCRKAAGYNETKKRITRNCITCGKNFETNKAWIKRGRGKFCSRECVKSIPGEKYWWKRDTFEIDIDLEDIKFLYFDKGLGTNEIAKIMDVSAATISTRLKYNGIKLRTNKEAQRLRSQQGKSKAENAVNWNGGRKINRGYIEIYEPSHIRSDKKGYVREHIKIWEQSNNKILPQGWVIHHLNGKKDDNRPENLFAMTNSGHTRREQAEPYKNRIRELEKEIQVLKKQLKP